MRKQYVMYLVLCISLIQMVYAGSYELKSECIYETNGPFIDTVLAADLDNDGIPEILAASNNGAVYNFKYRDCHDQWTATWQFIDIKDAVTDITVLDIDADGERDVVIGSLDRTRYLNVLEHDTTPKWKTRDPLDSVNTVDVHDVSGDGEYEVILGSKSKKVFMLERDESPFSYKLKVAWEREVDNPVYYVEAADLDNDGRTEVVALTNDQGKKATLYVFNTAGETIWTYSIDKGIYQANDYSISITDLDNDGRMEIVLGAYDKKLIVLDSGGKMLWEYDTDRLVSAVQVADLDGDGRYEIIFCSYPQLYLVDEDSTLKWTAGVDSSVLSMEVADLNRDGVKEIVVGSVKSIQILDSKGKGLGGWSNIVSDKPREINVRAIAVGDFDGDGRDEIAAGFGWEESMLDHNYDFGELRVFELEGDIPTTTSTLPSTTPSTTTLYTPPSTPHTTKTTMKPATTTTETEEEGGTDTGLLLLLGLGAIVLLIAVVIVAVIILKLKSGKKKEGDKDAAAEEDTGAGEGNGGEASAVKKDEESVGGKGSEASAVKKDVIAGKEKAVLNGIMKDIEDEAKD